MPSGGLPGDAFSPLALDSHFPRLPPNEFGVSRPLVEGDRVYQNGVSLRASTGLSQKPGFVQARP